MVELDPVVRFWMHSVIAGLLLSFLLFALVAATGNTFGQRCAKVFDRNTPEWEACLDRLSKGAQP